MSPQRNEAEPLSKDSVTLAILLMTAMQEEGMLCHAGSLHLWATVGWEHAHWVLRSGTEVICSPLPFPSIPRGGAAFSSSPTQDIHLWVSGWVGGWGR